MKIHLTPQEIYDAFIEIEFKNAIKGENKPKLSENDWKVIHKKARSIFNEFIIITCDVK